MEIEKEIIGNLKAYLKDWESGIRRLIGFIDKDVIRTERGFINMIKRILTPCPYCNSTTTKFTAFMVNIADEVECLKCNKKFNLSEVYLYKEV